MVVAGLVAVSALFLVAVLVAEAKEHREMLVDYLSRKVPGDGYQGMYVGVDWLEDDAEVPFAIHVDSHVHRPRLVSVRIVGCHL